MSKKKRFLSALTGALIFSALATPANAKVSEYETFTRTEGTVAIHQCTATAEGNFVARVGKDSNLSQYGGCMSGANFEFLVPQEGASLTVTWRINEALGAEAIPSLTCGWCDFVYPNGGSICGSLADETGVALGCTPQGVVVRGQDKTVTWDIPISGRGHIYASFWAQAYIGGYESIAPQQASIDADLVSVELNR